MKHSKSANFLKVPLWILTGLMLSVPALRSQSNEFHFYDVDSTEETRAVGFCKTLNYYWDQGVTDRSGTIYFVYVDNYKLFCHRSDDGGVSWQEEQILTGKEGYVFSAMIALTQDDRRVIVFSVNESFNNGTVGYSYEFSYDAYGAVEGDEGWRITPLSIHSANNGLLPYGMITVKDGSVHTVLSRYGWYNYGGELFEVVYDPLSGNWSEIATIRIFNDRNVDNATVYVGKLSEVENDELICMYQRNGTISGKVNVEIIRKTSEGWQEPQVVLENNSYSTYNRFDVDYDRHGHYYIAYFEPWSENGPQIFLSHNSTNSFTKYELFSAQDTLLKLSIHPYVDGQAYLYCTFRNSYPKILHCSEEGLSISSYLPSFEKEDSADVMRFLYNIPRKNNFSDNLDFTCFTNRYQGKDGEIVLKYPLVFMRTNLVQDFTGVPGEIPALRNSFSVYPNPAGEILMFEFENNDVDETIRIFSIQGKLVIVTRLLYNNSIDVSGLEPGIYIIKPGSGTAASRFIKN